MTLPAKHNATDSDQALLLAVAGGSREALERLYMAYYRRLARFLFRFTSRYDQVEEIVNDTFLTVWQGAGKFRRTSAVSTWIFGIAYRTALNSHRQRRLHDAERFDEHPEGAVDPAPAMEAQDWLSRGLDLLPAEQRLTLDLAYRMGYSIEEIAAITDCPIGTVKARMFYAREKLRSCLPALGGSVADRAGSRP
jgi:RNA polymerase sigma-70 factor (ECF subfamily)